MIELHFGIYLLLFLFFYNKIATSLFHNISYLILIFLIGICSSFFQHNIFYDFIKDFIYFLVPILSFITGYFVAKKINNIASYLRIIIYITSLFSITHVFLIFSQINFSTSSVSDIRRIGGISNIIEVFVLVILIGSYKFDFLDVLKNKLLKKAILIIVFLSAFLYFSRTMFVSFFILMLAIYGYLKITSKGIKYLFIVIVFFTLLYSYLFSINLDREKPGLESFLYKIKIAPSEIFTPVKTIDPNNHAYLWDHWRAYEATMAINQINTLPTLLFGKGFGALIDLKFEVFLGDTKMRYIPSIHNGYVFVFFKTGVLGLILHIFFLINLYLYSYKKSNSRQELVINYLISGIGIHFLFTSLIINGIYNIEELFVFMLGSLFYFRLNNENINYIKE